MKAPLILRPGRRFTLLQPEAYALRPDDISKAVASRRSAFTPSWSSTRQDDPGLVFIKLFGYLAGEVADRVRAMPEKALVEHLRIAGIDPLPATPAQAMVIFEVAATAPEPVLVPAGFQLGARPTGGGELVVFETDRALLGVPGKIAEAGAVRGSGMNDLKALNDSATPFQPFGARPRVGDALLLGLEGPVAPGAGLALGIGVTQPPGSPAPQSEGAVYPVPTGPRAVLSWEVLDGSRWVPVQPIRDETSQLERSGVIELKLPERFRPGRPPEARQGALRYWLRVRIVSSAFSGPPSLDFVRLNAVMAHAGRTVRDEVLEQVPGSDGRRLRLSQKPVLPGTLELEVDEGGGFQPWKEVEDLHSASSDDAVYKLERESGEVVFGDGINGRQLPPGFRNVRALSYRWGGGSAGAVKAEAIQTLLGSVSSVTGVTNPRPAAGGDDSEALKATVRRGPELIRARARTILPADYELLALRAPGARVRRVHVMPGRHPGMPSALVAGVVGLLVVPPEEEKRSGPPMPDEQTLRNVARHVSAELAPAGVEIVAAAPVYHSVRIEAQVRIRSELDQGKVVSDLLEAVRRYLHPLTGGEDNSGWPFGGTLRYDALLRLLVKSGDVLAVPRLAVIVDGRRVPPCKDREIGEHDLLWSVGTLIFPVEGAP